MGGACLLVINVSDDKYQLSQCASLPTVCCSCVHKYEQHPSQTERQLAHGTLGTPILSTQGVPREASPAAAAAAARTWRNRENNIKKLAIRDFCKEISLFDFLCQKSRKFESPCRSRTTNGKVRSEKTRK